MRSVKMCPINGTRSHAQVALIFSVSIRKTECGILKCQQKKQKTIIKRDNSLEYRIALRTESLYSYIGKRPLHKHIFPLFRWLNLNFAISHWIEKCDFHVIYVASSLADLNRRRCFSSLVIKIRYQWRILLSPHCYHSGAHILCFRITFYTFS